MSNHSAAPGVLLTAETNSNPSFRVRSSSSSKRWQAIVVTGLLFCSLVSLLTTVGIIVMLVVDSWGFFADERIDFWKFLTGTKWTVGQTQGKLSYGIWPLLSGTLRITGIAMMIALPMGLISAVYLSEYASQRVRAVLKPTLEILAGIPTVVLGFFAVKFITPYLLEPLGDFKTFNATSAGIAVGILCLPLVTSLAEDALRAVPNRLREGAYGLGSTRFAGDDRFTVNFGAGYRFLLTDAVALHIDFRDHLFDIDILGEDKTTHNLEAHLGVTVFF